MKQCKVRSCRNKLPEDSRLVKCAECRRAYNGQPKLPTNAKVLPGSDYSGRVRRVSLAQRQLRKAIADPHTPAVHIERLSEYITRTAQGYEPSWLEQLASLGFAFTGAPRYGQSQLMVREQKVSDS